MVWFLYVKNSSSLRIVILNCHKTFMVFMTFFGHTFLTWRPGSKYTKLQKKFALFKLWTSNLAKYLN